jgi:hypothetical protein
LAWANQAAFFIDPAGGDDEDDGATVGTALQTWAEYSRRVGTLVVPVYQIVTFLGDANEGTYQLRGRHPAGLTVQGETSVALSSTFGAATAIDTTTTPITEGRMTNAGGGALTAHVGKVVSVTSGAAAGAYAWILQDDPGGAGADVARVTEWFNPFTFARPVPAPGDAFEILDFVTVTGTWSVSATDPLSNGFIEWFLIGLFGGSLQPIAAFGVNAFLTTAKISQSGVSTSTIAADRFDMLGALLHTVRPTWQGGDTIWFSAGLLDAQCNLGIGARAGAQGNVVAQVVPGGTFQNRDIFVVEAGCAITTPSGGSFPRGVGFGVYDLAATQSAFEVHSLGQLNVNTTTGRFWTVDQAATSFGVRVDSMGLVTWPVGSTAPVAFDLDSGGAGVEFELGGAVTDAATLGAGGTITAANNAAAVPRTFP